MVNGCVRHVQKAPNQVERDCANRNVDQEHPAPAGDPQNLVGACEQTANNRPEHARRCKNGEDVALVASTFARRNDVAQHCDGKGEQATGAETLEGAGTGKLKHVAGEATGYRTDDENRDGTQEHAATAENVTELAINRCGNR